MHEPIAIVGIGCRFPGAPDVESFWRVLQDGVETVGNYSETRFDYIDQVYSAESVDRGLIASRRGGFVPDLDRFDAEFFGISPREAALLDPQQRMLMEVAWEAIEDAGIPAAKLAGSRTGVFVGLWSNDYEGCIHDRSRDLDFYATTGGGRYPASGRLAYFFDFRGPNLTVDTACSSSLVAIHLACQSLWNNESEMALAGGANAIISPETTIAYSASRMLSREGRCKFGDASADGYVRSEGAGVVLLKRLSQAMSDGDPIYAVIRGSATNNDGRSSGLLILPSREGQKEMLRAALHDADLAADMVDYVEAHGTGTQAGDPVEIEAITSVLAEKPRRRACIIGSVKTNFGHTEAASGVAGLIKVALSLSRRTIPASLHFHEPNPNIPWSKASVVIQTKTGPWPEGTTGPVAGVSGFGITGTNAHVILEGVPAPITNPATRDCSHIFLLSAHTSAALAARATSWRDRLLADAAWPTSLPDLAYTASVRRAHHDFRLALVARTRQELLDRIDAWLAKQEESGVRSGKRIAEEKRRAVFVFSGQGGQWLGMGRALLRDEPIFRATIEACDEAIYKCVGWRVSERLTAEDAEGVLSQDVIQPTLFAVTLGLAALWRSFGVEPDAVVGHSMGEVAAAATCGAISLDEAAEVICGRSRLMKGAGGLGLMVLAELSLEDAASLARDYGGRISVAANNGPMSSVLSGDADAIEDVLTKLESREIFCRRVKMDIAAHSAHMDPFRDELAQLLRDLHPKIASMPLYSTTTGNVEDGAGLDASHWSRNLRQPVLFSGAIQSLLRDGFDAFIELSPHPVLLQAIEDGIRHAGADAVAVASLRRDKDERFELLDALGALYVSGFPVNFNRLYGKGTCLRLPSYPWQRERHWLETEDGMGLVSRANRVHSRLGTHIQSSVDPGTHIWEAELPPSNEPIDHSVFLIDLGLAAASEALGAQPFVLENCEFFTPSAKDRAGQIVIAPSGQGRWLLRISAQADTAWSLRCSGTLRSAVGEPNAAPLSEYRARAVDDNNREPLRECFKFTAEILAKANRAGPYRVCKVDRLVWYNIHSQRKLIARAILPDDPESMEAACRLEPEGGPVVADVVGLHFEPVNKKDDSGHTYQLNWTNAKPPRDISPEKKSWILVGEASPLMDQITQRIESQGDNCTYASDAQSARRALESSVTPCGVVRLPRVDGTDPQNAARETFEIVLLVQALATAQFSQNPRLWLLSTGAWHLTGDSTQVAVAQGPSWGIGRAIASEYPEWHCTNIDLSSSPTAEELDILSAWLHDSNSEEQVAIRRTSSFVARFERSTSAGPNRPSHFSAAATYLITGGLGGVGLKVARWLVDCGARHVALVARNAPSNLALQEINHLKSAGATVRIFSADVANESQTSVVLQTIAKEMPPLRGVFHLAAVMDSALLTDVDEQQIQRAMHAKAAGAWVLHRQTENMPLDFFVLFSSMTAAIGQPGVSSYAAANAFVDALSRYRRAKGLKALSIQWGPWSELGLTNNERVGRGVKMYRQQGIGTLSFEETFNALGQLMRQDIHGALVAPIQWKEFARSFAGNSILQVFLPLLPSSEVEIKKEVPDESIRGKLLTAMPGRPRHVLLETHLQEVLAGILKINPSRLDSGKPLGLMGVDSLMALQFVRLLASTTSVQLPATAVFNYPTLKLLAAEIARRMGISLDAEVQPISASPIADNMVSTSSAVAKLSEEETIQALLQGGGAKQ